MLLKYNMVKIEKEKLAEGVYRKALLPPCCVYQLRRFDMLIHESLEKESLPRLVR